MKGSNIVLELESVLHWLKEKPLLEFKPTQPFLHFMEVNHNITINYVHSTVMQ